MSKNYRSVAEVCIDGGTPVIEQETDVVEAVPLSQIRCFGCGRTIDDIPFISVLNGIFHENCFRCEACKTLLDVTTYHVVDGKPHCDPPCPMQLNNQILVASTSIKKTSSVTDTTNPESGDPMVYQTVIVDTDNPVKVQSTPREYCSVCEGPIDSNLFVRALDGIFHNDCFRCHQCNRLLRVGNCQFLDGKLRCDPDCQESSALLERAKSALPLGERSEKTIPMTRYHFTVESDRENTPQTFHADAAEQMIINTLNNPKSDLIQAAPSLLCFTCRDTVPPGDRLETLNRVYHKTCFRCFKCNQRLSENKFNIVEENPCCQPYCGYDESKQYHSVYGSPSFEAMPSTMTYQQAVKKDVSPSRRITVPYSSSAPEKNDHLYLYQGNSLSAEPDWKMQPRSTSQPESNYCYSCNKKVYAAERLSALNRIYHRTCFRCHACNSVLNIGRFGAFEGKPYCEPHRKQLQSFKSGSVHNLRADFMEHDFDQMYEEPSIRMKPPTPEPIVYQTPEVKPIDPGPVLVPIPKKSPPASERMAVEGYPRETRRLTRDNFTVPTSHGTENEAIDRSAPRSNHVNGRKPSEAVNSSQNGGIKKKHKSTSSTDHSVSFANPSEVKKPVENVSSPNPETSVQKVKPTQRIPVVEHAYTLPPMETKLPTYDHVPPTAHTSLEERAKSVNPAEITLDQIYCCVCNKKVYPKERLFMLERWYHRTCFRCKACNNVLNIGRYSVHDDYPYCIPHHKQLMHLSNSSLHSLRIGVPVGEPNKDLMALSESMIYTSHAEPERTKSEPSTPSVFHRPRVPTVVQQQPIPLESLASPLIQRHQTQPVTRRPPEVPSEPEQIPSIRAHELDHRLCSRCQTPIGSEERIVYNDQVFHAKCAVCRICRINLGSQNGKELNGQLFCDVHFSQKLAAIQQSRRSGFTSTPGTPRPRSVPPVQNSTTPISNGSRPLSQVIPSFDHFVSDETMNALRQVAATSTSQAAMQHNEAATPVPAHGEALQAQHEQLLKRLNMLNGETATEPLVCANCHESVLPSTFLQLENKRYHFGCIKCQTCDRKLNRWNYNESNGSIYCSRHCPTNGMNEERSRPNSINSSRSSTPRRMSVDKLHCFVCEDSVYATEQLNVLDRTYHRSCFKCVWCHNTLGVENYYVHEGAPYCKAHYQQVSRVSNIPPETPTNHTSVVLSGLEQNLCHECKQPVHPREGMHVLDRFYHYGCFKCTDCHEVLNMGKYEVALSQPYCELDFVKNFGKNPISSSKTPPPRYTIPVGQD